MADNNPLRGAYLTCANEIRRLVVRASTEYHQSNSYIAEFFKISKRTVQRILFKFHNNAADSPANEALRLDYARWYIRVTLAGRKIIFIDEVGIDYKFLQML